MIYLTRPPYSTWTRGGTIQHFRITLYREDTEYYGICQQVEAQIMGLT
jgi:hypothetical protein